MGLIDPSPFSFIFHICQTTGILMRHIEYECFGNEAPEVNCTKDGRMQTFSDFKKKNRTEISGLSSRDIVLSM